MGTAGFFRLLVDFFRGLTEKKVRVSFSLSDRLDSMKEKKPNLYYCLMYVISQCFPVLQAEYLVFSSIHSSTSKKRVFPDHTQHIANLSNEARIEKHVLKSIPENVVVGISASANVSSL